MKLGEFLGERMGRVVMQGVFVLAAAVILLVTGTQAGIVVILGVFWVLLVSGVLIFDYFKELGHLRELESIMDGLDQKQLIMECAPEPDTVYERALFSLMRRAGRDMIETVSDARAAQKEYREYIESWVHEIKTPITAARLLCRNADKNLQRKLTVELAQIENHVERVLFYARAEHPEQDFLIRQTSLDSLVAEAIERHRSLLIPNGVRIETCNLEHVVYTDGKWVCFLLGQLLQNAVRYRSGEPVVTFSAKSLGNLVQLVVSDNGIGIPAQEVPRVFDRGFTGSNGRARGGSTGMGLYLCRKLADHLEIQLDMKSVESQGASVTLTFPAKSTKSSSIQH